MLRAGGEIRVVLAWAATVDWSAASSICPGANGSTCSSRRAHVSLEACRATRATGCVVSAIGEIHMGLTGNTTIQRALGKGIEVVKAHWRIRLGTCEIHTDVLDLDSSRRTDRKSPGVRVIIEGLRCVRSASGPCARGRHHLLQ